MTADPTKKRQKPDQHAAMLDEFLVATADKTLEQGPYVDGFSMRTIVGALFVAVVMMPGSVYLGLVAGQTLGPAAEWVTIILFAELARRSFTQLKRQEIFVLFYVASSVAAVTLSHLALSGGPIASIIWNQYLLQSPQTKGIAADIPDWVVPPPNSQAILERNLLHGDWWWSESHGVLGPIALIAFGYVFGRLAWFGLGYLVFRATSDHERLPFPLAPIAAQGATALAESTDREQGLPSSGGRSWRWTVFSVGACLGILFGAVYILVPVATGLFMTKPIMLLPIPFVDFTANVENLLPASLISISFDAGILLTGMILPFRLVLGIVTAVFLTSVLGNPILQSLGFFPHWTPGNGLLVNQMILSFDFWMSVTIGLAAAVGVVGIRHAVRTLIARTRERRNGTPPDGHATSEEEPARGPSRERGDFPLWVAFALFAGATAGFAIVSHILVPGFPFWVFLVFGFVWTPLHSYISARLIGLTGQGLATPFLKETVFITSGYKGVDIWFAPIPLFDVGHAAQKFRELELTRTRFTSLFKAELVMFPIIFVFSFLFWWFFWKMNQIPSDKFPFAARIWPVAARQAYLIFTANGSEHRLLLEALKPEIIVGAGIAGLALYAGLAFFRMPVIFFYGLVGGVGQPLHAALPLLIGALLSRNVFSRRFGPDRWYRYIPVIAAGFSCGMGLSGMTAVALALVAQCTRPLPF